MIRLRTKGFTLIELMITVAIVAILATIAYPAYRDQVLKTRRADAKGALMGLASAMERYFTQTNTYVGTAVCTGNNVPAGCIYANKAPLDSATKHYNLVISAADVNTYTLQAQPIPGGDQENDTKCGTLSLNQANTRDATGTAPTTCW